MAGFPDDERLQECLRFAPGVRILRQEGFETLISFLFSQNNNVPRIKGIIERLCCSFGDPIGCLLYTSSAFLILRYMFDDCNRLFIKKPSIIWCEHKRSNLIWRIHLKIESCYILWWRRHIWYLQHRFKRILESYLNIIPVFVMIRKTGKKERRHDSRPYLTQAPVCINSVLHGCWT